MRVIAGEYTRTTRPRDQVARTAMVTRAYKRRVRNRPQPGTVSARPSSSSDRAVPLGERPAVNASPRSNRADSRAAEAGGARHKRLEFRMDIDDAIWREHRCVSRKRIKHFPGGRASNARRSEADRSSEMASRREGRGPTGAVAACREVRRSPLLSVSLHR